MNNWRELFLCDLIVLIGEIRTLKHDFLRRSYQCQASMSPPSADHVTNWNFNSKAHVQSWTKGSAASNTLSLEYSSFKGQNCSLFNQLVPCNAILPYTNWHTKLRVRSVRVIYYNISNIAHLCAIMGYNKCEWKNDPLVCALTHRHSLTLPHP